MFVKVYRDVDSKGLDREPFEVLYDCDRMLLKTLGPKRIWMQLESNDGTSTSIVIQKDVAHTVSIINNEGKTIDSYQWECPID